MENENLGINILHWTSFVQMDKDRSGNVNRFKLNGDPNVSPSLIYWCIHLLLFTYLLPQVIFDRQKYAVSVSSKHGVCEKTMSVTFDYTYHLLVTISDVDAFVNDTVCSKALSLVSLYNLGYMPRVDGNAFTMRFDIRSLVTAIAANLDILDAWYDNP